jgi:SAM-dependent methyltransferase
MRVDPRLRCVRPILDGGTDYCASLAKNRDTPARENHGIPADSGVNGAYPGNAVDSGKSARQGSAFRPCQGIQFASNIHCVGHNTDTAMLLSGPKSRLFLRHLLAKFPLLEDVIRDSFETLRQIIYRRDVATIKSLPLFSPFFGSGPHKTIATLAVLSANQTFPFIVNFIEIINNKPFSKPIPITLFSNTLRAQRAAIELKSLFDQYGSDKATHNYHHLYGHILQDHRDSVITMLEIGLGTNYSDVASSMGPDGKPGASLRAFAEFLPLAYIYGADIDRRILFQETRIRTFFVDQTNLESFRSLASQIDCKFDVIIDDGLHSPNANIATLSFACEKLKAGGWFVVEDIGAAALPVWRVISALLPNNYRSWLIDTEGGFLFAMWLKEPPIGED